MFFLLRKFSTFKRNQTGAVAVEFAFIFPLMLMLFLGAVETTDFLSANQRVEQVSSSLGDLVARSRPTLPKATLTDYFKAVGNIMAPYPSDSLAQVVTSVFVDDKGKAKVEWSCGYNKGKTHPKNSIYKLPAEFTTISKNRYVIISEAQMPYTPKFGYGLSGTFNLYRESFYNTRFGAGINKPC